ncbi:MAG: NAD(+) synthase, partial [Actinomycetota bacterium]|nr:NAD(+) synthase [Actinomycetota bacterium]
PVSPARLTEEAEIYEALVTGLRGYVRKNGFAGVVIGSSGGIDSALASTIAVDALGPDAVHTITMPTRYSSEGSVEDSRSLASNLGCRFDVVPIEDTFESFLKTLDPLFEGTEPDVAEENLQARIRGTILMGISNKFGGMVVATGNKSEMAVGYATLYGDMAGGYAVLKDVYKTLVYRLSRWRNREREVIPMAIIEKAPSAELRPDQFDTDSLPPYELLDAVLEEYIESDRTVDEIADLGYDREAVCRIARMVDRNEYKRRQAPPGVKITRKGFGRDRRLPITNRYLNQ